MKEDRLKEPSQWILKRSTNWSIPHAAGSCQAVVFAEEKVLDKKRITGEEQCKSLWKTPLI
jgi:hypothetical protein